MQPVNKNGMEEKGVAHVFAAFGYSMSGARFLFREEAAKLEVVLMVVASIAFAVSGAGFADYAILLAIFMGLLCVEALNTALEYVVDHTSPEISEYGKAVKDLGSFAVFCALSIFCCFALYTVVVNWI